MTVATTNHVATHGLHVPSLRSPVLILVRSIGRLLKACGRGLVDVSTAYALAQELAYVKPGGVRIEKKRLAFDTDGEGRDPSW